MLRPSAPITEIQTRLAMERKYSWSISGTTRKKRIARAATVYFAIGNG